MCTETDQKQWENIKFSNLYFLNKNVNIVLKPLILDAHEAAPCAPELGHITETKQNKGQLWTEMDRN